MLELKVKKLHPDAKLPTKAHASDATGPMSSTQVSLLRFQRGTTDRSLAVPLLASKGT